MAKPHPKGPQTTVEISCSGCRTLLLKYRKGGKGSLVKCFKERINADLTQQPGICPKCGRQFARETLIRGAPALKIIGGKVQVR
ncbi:MAG: hypothetical protein OQK12_18455 [Motiliproteus sp.]|nr:hypothetical protein [Motiliproteus sp.]MCW9053004.1 hypothetical protein [Motiliproteus sp.]